MTMRKIGKIVLWSFAALVASAVVSVIYYIFFSIFVSTDVEKRLMEENRILRKELPEVEEILSLLDGESTYLGMRDRNIYKQIFKTDEPSVSLLLDGSLLDSRLSVDEVLRRSDDHSARAVRTAARVEENWRAVMAAVERDKAEGRPVVSPVRSLSHSNIGASIGLKMNPFYKVQVFHEGLDIVSPAGTPVYATAGGRLTDVRAASGGKGNMIEITHGGGYVTRYAHLEKILVPKGSFVKAGTMIGTVGDSGRAFTTHLHYEVVHNGKVLDPTHFLFGSITPDEYLKMLIMSTSSGQSLD